MFKLNTARRVVVCVIFQATMAFLGFQLPAWIVSHTVQYGVALFGAILFCAGWIVSTAILAIWMVSPPEVNA